jgi:hypothetical protein
MCSKSLGPRGSEPPWQRCEGKSGSSDAHPFQQAPTGFHGAGWFFMCEKGFRAVCPGPEFLSSGNRLGYKASSSHWTHGDKAFSYRVLRACARQMGHHRCAMPQRDDMARHSKPAHFELYGRQCEARPTPLLVCEYPPEPAVDTRKSSILLPCIQHEPARVSDSRTRAPSHKCFCCQILAFACSSPCCFSCIA